MNKCSHRYPESSRWEDVEVGLLGETEPQLVSTGGKSANVDLDVGRFRCALCGEVGYYTGLWRAFYEDGVPCPGSESIRRDTGLGQMLHAFGDVVSRGAVPKDTLRRILAEMLEMRHEAVHHVPEHAECKRPSTPASQPLTVSLAPLQESNGRETWVVMLHRGNDQNPLSGHQVYADTIEGRARYEADCLRAFLAGTEQPDVLAYETDAPSAEQATSPASTIPTSAPSRSTT